MTFPLPLLQIQERASPFPRPLAQHAHGTTMTQNDLFLAFYSLVPFIIPAEHNKK